MRRRVSIPALIIVILVTAAVALLGARIWREGAMGCARAFDRAAYFDADEIDRLGFAEPAPTEHIFTDDAYDEVFPDLYEPANGEN